MKLLSREPRDFYKALKELTDESVMLVPAGLKGVGAKSTTDHTKPDDTATSEKLTKASFLLVVKVLVALRQGRPVKLVHSAKSWEVCFGPRPETGAKTAG